MSLHRIALPFLNAVFITACLLYLMFSLINIGEPRLLPKSSARLVDWVRIPDDELLQVVSPKPEPITNPLTQPQVVHDKPIIDVTIAKQTQWTPIDIKRGSGVLAKPIDNQLVLALGYPPSYPQSLANRGVEGYVVVGFSVSASGQVFDPFIIESEPKRLFDRSALTAIAKFKYKPQVRNGKAISTVGQRYLFRYELDK